MAALVGAQPITATRGVNPYFMLQLRCATFAFAAADHACSCAPCSVARRPASIAGNRDERISAHETATEETMKATVRSWRYLMTPLVFAGMLNISSAAELNPAAVIYKLPDQIPWGPVNAAGAQSAVVVGDPAKPGFYMVYNKWTKGNHFSRPHFHPNDRYIVVLQGTWWVGSGPKFDPANTTPMPAGSFVTHFAKQVHWDGARDEDAVLLILGEGPATSTAAEEK
jgi:hypothetical protein